MLRLRARSGDWLDIVHGENAFSIVKDALPPFFVYSVHYFDDISRSKREFSSFGGGEIIKRLHTLFGLC